METFSCEYVVPHTFRNHYDLDDTESLDAFHAWLGRRLSDALLKKYGRRVLDAIPQQELWLDDLGLVADCDFKDLPDGAMQVTFSRAAGPLRDSTSYPKRRVTALGTEILLDDIYA